MTDVRIDLPWGAPPLSANQRMHWRTRAALTRELRDTARLLTRRLPRTDRLVVTLHYLPKAQRRRDRHNLYPTVKALVDGIVDAGVVPDDDTVHVSTPEPVIHQPDGTGPKLWLELHYPNVKGDRG